MLAITGQQVKGVEPWFTPTKQEIGELGIARIIEAHDLTIEHCTLSTASRGKAIFRAGKALNSFPLSGHQSAVAVFDVCQRTKSVPLDLEDPIGMGEWRGSTAERHGLEQHLHTMILES